MQAKFAFVILSGITISLYAGAAMPAHSTADGLCVAHWYDCYSKEGRGIILISGSACTLVRPGANESIKAKSQFETIKQMCINELGGVWVPGPGQNRPAF